MAAKKKGVPIMISLTHYCDIEIREAEASIKRDQRRQSKEDSMAIAQKKWSEILPKFDSM